MLKKMFILKMFVFAAFAAELSLNERFMSDSSKLVIAHKFDVADVEAKNFSFTPRTLKHATSLISGHVNMQIEFETGSTNLELITAGPASSNGIEFRPQTHIEFPHRQRLETRRCPTDMPKHGLIATALTAYNHHQPLALL